MAKEIINIHLTPEEQEGYDKMVETSTKYYDDRLPNITVNGLDDADAADLIEEQTKRNSVNEKNNRTTRRLTGTEKKSVTSLFEQLDEALKQYEENRDTKSLSEHKALLSLKENQAASGNRGGVALRKQSELSESTKKYVKEVNKSEEKYRKALGKQLAALLYKGRITNAQSLIEEFRSKEKDLDDIKVYLDEFRVRR